MSSVFDIPSGHAGSGRDGRRGDREKRGGTGESVKTIGHFDWCVHQLEMGDDLRPQHDCLEFENQLRDNRHCPPIERRSPSGHE